MTNKNNRVIFNAVLILLTLNYFIMNSVNLQAAVENFKHRLFNLYHDSLDNSLVEKYIGIYQVVLEAEDKPEQEIAGLAKNIAFIGNVAFKRSYQSLDGNGLRLLLFKKDGAFKKSVLCKVSDVGLNDNVLIWGKEFPKTAVLEKVDADTMQKLKEITVYSKGEPTRFGYNNPLLTVREVVSQIPAELIPSVTAFGIQLEDSDPLANYNVIMKRYCFKVILYTGLVKVESGSPIVND